VVWFSNVDNYCSRRKSIQQNKTAKSHQINISNVLTEKQPIDNIIHDREDQLVDTDSEIEESTEDQQIEDDSMKKQKKSFNVYVY
jgi:hypothetical protein